MKDTIGSAANKHKEKVTFELTEDLYAGLKDIKLDKECDITLRVKAISLSKGSQYGWDDEEDGGSKKLRGRFEILEATKAKEKSTAQLAAEKIMADKKKPRII